MISFWERETLLENDIAIVGGGIVGLSAASSIKEKHPNRQVTVYERSVFPYGASTRNAGFACFGSPTEILSDIKLMGKDRARELLFKRWMGLQITRQRLSDELIDYRDLGGFELLDKGIDLNFIEAINEMVADFLPEYLSDADDLKQDFGIAHEGTLVRMDGEGQLHAGKLMQQLELYASSLGVVIRSGATVKSIEGSEDSVELSIADAERGDMRIQANHVVVCNNAWAQELLLNQQIKPGRGQVLITHPIQDLRFRGNLHLDEGFYYLRNVDNRILIGGGRNLDIDGETSHKMELNTVIQESLIETIQSVFGKQLTFEVDQQWAGIMAFGESKMPLIESVGDNITVAARMSGMGIALAGFVGEEVSEMLSC